MFHIPDRQQTPRVKPTEYALLPRQPSPPPSHPPAHPPGPLISWSSFSKTLFDAISSKMP